MSSASEWQTIPEVVAAARIALTPPVWAFSGSGPETEVTVRRSRAAFDRLALLPRVLRGVGDRDLSTTFLGHRLTLPVVLAPVGSIQVFHPEGAQPSARVAGRMGTLSFVATNATPRLEQTRPQSDGPLIYQLYVYGDREWQERMLPRIENAGYDAVCLPVDSPDSGTRDRRYANRSAWWSERAFGDSDPDIGGRSFAERNQYLAGLTWDDMAWIRHQTKL